MVQITETPIGHPAGTDRAAEQKRRILGAASRVFRAKGLHATGMRDIASELQMHVGNLYYYFRNKGELLAFCQEEALSGLLDAAKSVETIDLPVFEKLRRLIITHVERVNELTPGSLAHLEIEALEDPWRHRLQTRRDEYECAYRQLIEEGVSTGVFRDLDARVATMAILGALNWTVKWFRPDGGKTATQIGREFADLLVGGLMAEEA
jgi:AcrR family transcriptional regulator